MCPTLCDPINCSTPVKLTSIELVMPSNHLILCRPLLLLTSVFPSSRIFSNESALCIRWPKYWSFSFSLSPSNEYSGLISFRIDCLDLLAVQGILKSLLQHHSSKASILWCSAFFIENFLYAFSRALCKCICTVCTLWVWPLSIIILRYSMLLYINNSFPFYC